LVIGGAKNNRQGEKKGLEFSISFLRPQNSKAPPGGPPPACFLRVGPSNLFSPPFFSPPRWGGDPRRGWLSVFFPKQKKKKPPPPPTPQKKFGGKKISVSKTQKKKNPRNQLKKGKEKRPFKVEQKLSAGGGGKN